MTVQITVIGGTSAVRGVLQELAEEHGEVLAPDVVEAARPETSPIHDRFTWDNDAAGEKCRLLEAQALIRSVKFKVVRTHAPGEVVRRANMRVRAYTSQHQMGTGPAGSYVPTNILDPFQQEIRLRQMRREIASLRRRYGDLQEFWAVLAELAAEHPEDGDTPAAASG